MATTFKTCGETGSDLGETAETRERPTVTVPSLDALEGVMQALTTFDEAWRRAEASTAPLRVSKRPTSRPSVMPTLRVPASARRNSGVQRISEGTYSLVVGGRRSSG